MHHAFDAGAAHAAINTPIILPRGSIGRPKNREIRRSNPWLLRGYNRAKKRSDNCAIYARATKCLGRVIPTRITRKVNRPLLNTFIKFRHRVACPEHLPERASPWQLTCYPQQQTGGNKTGDQRREDGANLARNCCTPEVCLAFNWRFSGRRFLRHPVPVPRPAARSCFCGTMRFAWPKNHLHLIAGKMTPFTPSSVLILGSTSELSVHPDAGASYSYHNWRYFPVPDPGKNGVQKFTADLFSHGLSFSRALRIKPPC